MRTFGLARLGLRLARRAAPRGPGSAQGSSRGLPHGLGGLAREVLDGRRQQKIEK